jgi:hypothetical protein
MSYIGSTPTTQSFIAGTDSFNGDGSATNFTLSRFVNSVNDVQVVVNNVVQYPPNYSVSGNTLTISPAPSAGTNNVYVRYLSTTLQSITIPGGSTVVGGFNVTGSLGVGTASPAVLLHAQSTTATTNAVTQVLRIDSQSSGTPANGIGVGMQFATETSAGNTEIGATIEAITTDVTAASEDFDLSFKTMAAGATAAEIFRAKSTGDFQFNSGYGSVATVYGCRAWVNFNGTGTVAIRASGNVSSITDNGTGDYTVNFTTAMADANYSAVGSTSYIGTSAYPAAIAFNNNNSNAASVPPTTTALRVSTRNINGNQADIDYVYVSIFR